MRYSGERLSQISFPVGGIGAGSVGLSGTGRLVDWEIFNHPAKGSANGNSHFGVRAERNGQVLDYRVLHGDFPPPMQGSGANGGKFFGLGFGPDYSAMCGWPHFEKCLFDGRFPVAELSFGDRRFPGRASLAAWSPFIPGDSRTSSMPLACFDVSVANTSAETLTYSVFGVLANPWPKAGHVNALDGASLVCRSGLPEDDLARGEVALTVVEGDGALSAQAYWYRGGWCDGRETFFRDVLRGGDLADRVYPESADIVDHGALCLRFPLAPGESRRVRFALTWHVPFRSNDWNAWAARKAAELGIPNRWRNWYATEWPSAVAVARDFAARHAEIARAVKDFRDALFASTLPEAAVEGISANLSTLVSPTCLRLEDGTFYGWEGVGMSWGSCEGSCTHVWNYAQALPFLFPDLERSMREANFRYGVDEFGASHFRLNLPLGIKATPDMFRACVDGQFGDVMKTFRDWRLSGDDDWLRRWWPTVRKLVEYAWSPDNPDCWDPRREGVVSGRQHHTLDMELFGPNAWLTSHYLGALRAAAAMARAVGDDAFAATCDEVFARGRAFVDERLFRNGHFIQRVDLKDRSVTDAFDASATYWNDEAGEIKYQYGDGYEIDGALGDYYSRLYGIGPVLDPEKVRAHLLAVLGHNFVPAMRDHFNPWRTYTMDDEAGVVMCTWDEGSRPAIPLTYNSETMNGFEWTFAAHLACFGLLDEAAQVVRAIRDRYDGAKRNPWNEIECGSNYARSLASYGLLPVWSGFSFDRRAGTLGFAPKPSGDFRAFWSIGTAWGTFSFTAADRSCRLDVLHGSLPLKTLRLGFEASAATFCGIPLVKSGDGAWTNGKAEREGRPPCRPQV